MVPLVKKLVQMVKAVMPLVPMVQMLPTNGTIGRTRIHATINACEFIFVIFISDLLYRSSIRQEDYITELEILDTRSRGVNNFSLSFLRMTKLEMLID